MNVSFLQELLNTVAEQGRTLIPWSLKTASPADDIKGLTRALVSGRGEASGVAIARQVIACYRALAAPERKDFFLFLASELQPNPDLVAERARAYVEQPDQAALSALQAAVESPRQEFFRRLNLAPGATAEIIGLRLDLLNHMRTEPALGGVDHDLRHLLQSWFNRGFLVLRRIDWQTPAAILEKIIAYEAVHEIRGWDDLRRRLEPADRRCFAYFHPSLVDEPLIFVEVALMRETPGAIGDVLAEARKGSQRPSDPTTAVFYSISNCQEGLKGISFGNFLIKHVVEDLLRELPSLKTFVTLSPVPHFARWLDRMAAGDGSGVVTADDRIALKRLRDPGWHERAEAVQALKGPILALASHYFMSAKSGDGRAVDPVARFHLGNGARLERLNWLGDTSEKGLTEAHGLMVNYLYNLEEIERNHEAYANEGMIAASKPVHATLRPVPKSSLKPPVQDQRRLAPPAPKTAAADPAKPPVEATGRGPGKR
jgi:malonyl-CoA decarboxylase